MIKLALSASYRDGSMKRLMVLLVVLAGATSCSYRQPDGEMCGNAGAASFSIPRSEIYMWETGAARQQSHAGNSFNIAGAVLMLRWPGMESRSNENYKEFNKTYMESMGPTPWISILMIRPDKPYSREFSSERLSGRLERIVRQGGVLKNMNDMYGLKHAVYHSAPGRAYQDVWFYWGDAGDAGVVGHHIICENAMPVRPPDKLRMCTNVFYMHEINMEVNVNFRDDMLRDWSKIQQEVRAHLLSKIKECVVEGGA